MHFQGVLFDMDGLLLDTEQLVVGSILEVGRSMGFTDLEPSVHRMIGLRVAQSSEILRQGLAGRVDLATFQKACDSLIAARVEQGIPVKPGAIELLQRLEAKEIPCAVATSTATETAEKHLEMAGLRHYFRSVTGGDMVRHAKPSPEIYLLAAETIGVSANESAAFEDSEPGVRAAHAAGACVVQIPDLVPPSENLRALGHTIAPSLLHGAVSIGLIEG